MSMLIDILREGLRTSLKGVPFAEALLRYCVDGISLDSYTVASLARAGRGMSVDLSQKSTSSPFMDLRFKRVLMRGVRKFPASTSSVAQIAEQASALDRYYCVNFGSKDRRPKSTVVLGQNGIGKSSVYTCLEKIALQQLYSARTRGYESQEEQDEYIRHIGTQAKDSTIILHSESGYYIDRLSDKTPLPLLYPAYFCMEYDIERMTKKIDGEYIAEQIGELDFLRLIKTLENLSDAYGKMNDSYVRNEEEWMVLGFLKNVNSQLKRMKYGERRKFMQTIQDLDLNVQAEEQVLRQKADEIDSELLEIGGMLFPLQPNRYLPHLFVAMTNIEIDFADVTLSNADAEKFSDMVSFVRRIVSMVYTDVKDALRENRRGKLSFNSNAEVNLRMRSDGLESENHSIWEKSPLCGISEENYGRFLIVFDFLRTEYSKILKDLKETASDVVKEMMRDYFGRDIEDIDVETQDGMELRILVRPRNLVSGKRMDLTDPRKFLNTFRFKVFCVALKASLAFTCSKMRGLNAPLVIDDVFDSSDFANRENIKDFIVHMYKAHHKVFGWKQPLQLIFFTQDDLIGDSVHRGILESLGRDEVSYCRLYDYTEAFAEDESSESFLFLSLDEKDAAAEVRVADICERIGI